MGSVLIEVQSHLKNSSTIQINYGYFIKRQIILQWKIERKKINVFANILQHRKKIKTIFRWENPGPECSGNLFKFTFTGGNPKSNPGMFKPTPRHLTIMLCSFWWGRCVLTSGLWFHLFDPLYLYHTDWSRETQFQIPWLLTGDRNSKFWIKL